MGKGPFDGIPLILLSLEAGVQGLLCFPFSSVIKNNFRISLCSVLCC